MMGASFAQNEGKKWYFGDQAALDFMTNPPSVILSSAMYCYEGSASIADAAGNMLFYTNGTTIYNQSNISMTGGTFMAGSNNATQSSVIVKKPGSSTLYYVFLVQGNGGGFYYSIVDMSLSGGLGAVTVTNTSVNSVNTEKLTATKHCNGTDTWILTHDWGNNHFLAYLLTSAGLSSPVVSSVGSVHGGIVNNVLGAMKISPTGKKLGLAIWATINAFELYDFDNTTGIVSNPVFLGNTFLQAYGCEFSPDGSKFYGSCEVGTGVSIYQWDVCAGNGSAIIASQYTVCPASAAVLRNGLQVGPDGKIYVARNLQSVLGTINSPNLAGAACNYLDGAQTMGGQLSTRGLPNFISSFFKPAQPPITYTTNMAVACYVTSLSCAANTVVQIGCSTAGYSLVTFHWLFGDPASGFANSSALQNPVHTYPAPGSYTAQLILNYSCGGGNDTVSQVVVISTPTLSVLTPTTSCNGQTAATVTAVGGSGNNSFTWTPSGFTTSVITNIAPGSYTVVLHDNIGGCTSSLVTSIVTPANNNPVLSTSHVTLCSLNTTVLAVSGATSYTWNPGNHVGNLYTITPSVNTTYTVIGQIASCTAAAIASVTMLGGVSPTITSLVTVCNGHVLQINGGGGNSYLWQGPGGATYNTSAILINPVSAIHAGVYSLTAMALSGCTAALSATVTVISSPTLTALGNTVCVGQPLTFAANASSGSTFYWSGPNSFTSSLQNPFAVSSTSLMSGVYTVTVTNVAQCYSTASVQGLVLSVPVPSIVSQATACTGDAVQLNGSGGNTSTWQGPTGFNSALQNPLIASVSPSHSGTYTLVASNGYCSANAVKSLTVFAVPHVTLVSNSPVCETKSLSLHVLAGAGVVSYKWLGPFGFSDSLNYTGRDSTKLSFAGVYSITVTNIHSCKTSVKDSAFVTPKPVLVVSGATVCLNEKAILKATGAVSYSWTGPGVFYSNTASPLINSASHVQPYQYTVVGSANNCTSVAYATVLTRPLPTLSINLSDTRVCANATLAMSAEGGRSYKWECPGELIYREKNVVTAPFTAGINNYTLTVTDSAGCYSRANATVQVDPRPFGTVSKGKINSCVPFCETYSFTSAGGPLKSITWRSQDSLYKTVVFKPCYNKLGDFPISVLFTDTNGCSSTINYTVTAFPKPEANFSYAPDLPVENTNNVFFTNTSSNADLSKSNWYFSDNERKSVGKDASYFYRESGTYAVALVVRNNRGCEDSVIKTVQVAADFHIYVPNAFTPGNDQLNEVFLPVGRGIKNYQLSIYNRWGNIVFSSSELQNGWDGTFKDLPCSTDTYQWKIHVTSERGESRNLIGHVTLIR